MYSCIYIYYLSDTSYNSHLNSPKNVTVKLASSMISAVHPDVVREHILSRLDGVSLSSFACTSSYNNTLSSQETLWKMICTSTWPSLDNPRVLRLISDVPNGHRSLFRDSFPLLALHEYDQPRNNLSRPSQLPSELISAVDIWYQEKPIFSRVIETQTESCSFSDFPFRVDLVDPKETRPGLTLVKMGHSNDDECWISPREVEQNLTLSWIIFDPKTKRSANFSSTRALSMERHWLPGGFDVEYGTILVCDRVGYVECKVVVTCGGLEDGELHVREACMQVKDMDGKYLNGKDSLACLVNAIEFGERKRVGEKEGAKMHEAFSRRKRLRLEKRVFREHMLDMAYWSCIWCSVLCILYVVVKR